MNGGSDRLRVKRAKKTARFPYPPEETEGSYQDKVEVSEDFLAFPFPLKETGTYLFPPPLEVTGVSYHIGRFTPLVRRNKFPSPLEVNGGSYTHEKVIEWSQQYCVSVPFRGDWGVLQSTILTERKGNACVSVPSRGDWGVLLAGAALIGFLGKSFRPLSR